MTILVIFLPLLLIHTFSNLFSIYCSVSLFLVAWGTERKVPIPDFVTTTVWQGGRTCKSRKAQHRTNTG